MITYEGKMHTVYFLENESGKVVRTTREIYYSIEEAQAYLKHFPKEWGYIVIREGIGCDPNNYVGDYKPTDMEHIIAVSKYICGSNEEYLDEET